ncbi:MAG TPA: PIG-L deacetylase family protein [Thermoleophilaceae bacterium]|nr:PIG-L deacetylase family protein [Thermoleophilaceae bacterium]
MTARGVVVVTAHPDDETLIAGGVLAACSAAGLETGVICLTRGEHGPIADPALATRDTLGDVREAELRDACADLGVSWVKCYRRQDAHLPWTNSTAVTRQIAQSIDASRPRAVITFGEDGLYYHPDHIAVHRFTRRALDLVALASPRRRPWLYEAVWRAGRVVELARAMRERGLPSDLWGIAPADFGVEDEDGAVELDVRPFLERKLSALRRHRSQLDPGHLFSALPADLAERHLGWERFRRVWPARGRRDWLTDVVAEARG